VRTSTYSCTGAEEKGRESVQIYWLEKGKVRLRKSKINLRRGQSFQHKGSDKGCRVRGEKHEGKGEGGKRGKGHSTPDSRMDGVERTGGGKESERSLGPASGKANAIEFAKGVCMVRRGVVCSSYSSPNIETLAVWGSSRIAAG